MQPSEEHSVKSYSKRMIAGLMGYPGSFTFFSSFFHLFAIYPSFMSSEKDALGDIKKMRKLLLLNSCDVKYNSGKGELRLSVWGFIISVSSY